MTHAYDSKYLSDAMNNLGEMLDYMVNICHMDVDDGWDLFLATGYADQFGSGWPRVVSGLSGTELAWEILRKAGFDADLPEPATTYGCSLEYWCGWILAHYQWYTGRSFKNIRIHLSMRELQKLYPTLHEASEDKFVDTVNRKIRRGVQPTRLKTLRMAAGYSQRQLADRTAVSLRAIQQYEQRTKDINRAAASSLQSIARAFGCRIEDLLEHDCEDVVE